MKSFRICSKYPTLNPDRMPTSTGDGGCAFTLRSSRENTSTVCTCICSTSNNTKIRKSQLLIVGNGDCEFGCCARTRVVQLALCRDGTRVKLTAQTWYQKEPNPFKNCKRKDVHVKFQSAHQLNCIAWTFHEYEKGRNSRKGKIAVSVVSWNRKVRLTLMMSDLLWRFQIL